MLIDSEVLLLQINYMFFLLKAAAQSTIKRKSLYSRRLRPQSVIGKSGDIFHMYSADFIEYKNQFELFKLYNLILRYSACVIRI